MRTFGGRVLLVFVTALALVATSSAPASAAFTDPRKISPDGSGAGIPDQATDRQGDTTFAWIDNGKVLVRVLRADGSMTPVRTVSSVGEGISLLRVAVDDDGDGVVVWDEYDDVASPLYARPVTRRGVLGDVRRIAPSTHDVRDANVAMRPRGSAVVTWVRLKDASYSPWVRTFSLSGRLGRALQVGRGPNAGAPGVDIDRDGRALLGWSNTGIVYVRRLAAGGALSSTVRVHRSQDLSDNTAPIGVSVDRDGDALVTWNRQQGVSDEAWGRRVSRGLRPLGKARRYSRTSHQAVAVEADMDLQGDAVVAWHVNYFAGVFARRVRRDGAVGPIVRLGDGGLGGVFLDDDGDGGVAWFGYTRDGLRRSIRVTRLPRGGGFGRTVQVGRNGYDTSLVRIDGTPRGRMTVSWEEEPSDGAHVMAVRGR